jgi:hypothetical protein
MMYAYSIRLHTHTYIYIYTRTLYTCITNYTITYTGKCEPPKSWKPKRTCGKNIRSSCVVNASSSLSLSRRHEVTLPDYAQDESLEMVHVTTCRVTWSLNYGGFL